MLGKIFLSARQPSPPIFKVSFHEQCSAGSVMEQDELESTRHDAHQRLPQLTGEHEIRRQNPGYAGAATTNAQTL